MYNFHRVKVAKNILIYYTITSADIRSYLRIDLKSLILIKTNGHNIYRHYLVRLSILLLSIFFLKKTISS